jgi:hypothetical protein
MFKKLFALVLLAVAPLGAGTITRTYTYSNGSVIDADQNNTNENTLYNEINGNLDAANIENNTLTTDDVLDGTLTATDMASSVTSTFTFVNRMGYYTRPRLNYAGVTTVNVVNNTGTSNETCVMFIDEVRCVTEDTGSSTQYRLFNITETAANSGTHNSGLVGASEAANTWYALYAWKTSDDANKFVVAGTTNTPTTTNLTRLNSMFGTGKWVYLGMIANGDNAGATGDIKSFSQTGNLTLANITNTSGNTFGNLVGLRLAATASASTLTWSYAAGTAVGTNLPTNVTAAVMQFCMSPAANELRIYDSGAARIVGAFTSATGNSTCAIMTVDPTTGFQLQNGAASNETYDIHLIGWFDGALGLGTNPQQY